MGQTATTAAPDALDSPALIDLILERFHAGHRAELPALAALARQVEAAARRHPAAPAGLAELLDRLQVTLASHMQKEEDGLFPAMRAGATPAALAVEIMRDEHDEAVEDLRQLVRLTRDHTVPADASAGWRELCDRTRRFEAELREHIRLENEVLFPRFGA
jgi:regulator of cell morphogenesis and NO signaling